MILPRSPYRRTIERTTYVNIDVISNFKFIRHRKLAEYLPKLQGSKYT